MAAAEETLVEYAGGHLTVKRRRRWRTLSPFSHVGSVDVLVELPAGSRVSGDAAMGSFRSTGPLGDTRLKTAHGVIEVDDAATVVLEVSAGDVSLVRSRGDAQLTTGSGAVRAGEIGGAGLVKNSNGDSRVDEVAGDLRIKSANGDIAVGLAHASVNVATANGAVRVGAVERGSVVAETGLGAVEVGIAEGTAAWLDLATGHGRVNNALEAGGPPGAGEETVEVRVRSGLGDITIRRAAPSTRMTPSPATT